AAGNAIPPPPCSDPVPHCVAGVAPPGPRPPGPPPPWPREAPRHTSEVCNVTSLPGHRQAYDDGQQRLARDEQNPPPLHAEPARTPVLGRQREPLGEAARFHRRTAHHRQERHRRRPRRAAQAWREGLRSRTPWHPSATRSA